MSLLLLFLLTVTPRQIVRIYLSTPQEVGLLADMNLDYASDYVGNYLDVVVTDEEFREIRSRGFKTEVRDVNIFVPPEYHSYEETWRTFDSLRRIYPDLCRLDTVGRTHWRNLPILGVKLSKYVNSVEDEARALFTGMIHAREPLANEIIIYAAKYILTNYATNPQVRRWVDSSEIWFIPVINPDGWKYVVDSNLVNPWWRKNQRDNNNNGRFDPNYDGVDLNRNFDWLWTQSGSTNPADWTYRGPAPNSEREVQTQANLARLTRPVFEIDYHSYGQIVYYSWSNTPPPPDGRFIRLYGECRWRLEYELPLCLCSIRSLWFSHRSPYRIYSACPANCA